MANIKLSLGVVAITDYLIVRIREVTAPGAEVARQVFGPSPSTAINIAFTNVNPVTHYVDFYESSDGTALTSLLSLYTVDASTNQLMYERRFYTVGGPGANDPAAGQANLTDAYFNGKSIVGFSQRGFGPLIPTAEWSLSGTTISNLLGNFSGGDVYMVEISYLQVSSATINTNFFGGIATIISNTTFDSTYYNKRIRLNGGKVHTLPSAGAIPDGKFFYFSTQGLAIPQIKIVPSGADTILFNDQSLTEISLGTAEHLWLEKTTIGGIAVFEVISGHENIQQVGRRFTSTSTQHPNALAEDGSLFNASDYPRLWYWINHNLPAGTFVIDNSLDSMPYTWPANKQGCFIISTVKQKFRMPNTQGLFERGLKDFNSYGADTTRNYDYPGGFQDEMVGPHIHPADDIQTGGATDAAKHFIKRKSGSVGGGLGINAAPGGYESDTEFTGKNLDGLGNITTEQRVKNVGVINMRCI